LHYEYLFEKLFKTRSLFPKKKINHLFIVPVVLSYGKLLQVLIDAIRDLLINDTNNCLNFKNGRFEMSALQVFADKSI